MQYTRKIFLMLLFTLLALGGCSRREVLDEYPVSGVDIALDWDGVTDKLPEGVRVIFYPKNAGGKKIDTYLSVKGGKVKVPPGRYSVVLYNYDTEAVQVRNEGSYETIEAFTGCCSGLGIGGTEELVWGPDPFYVVSMDELQIKKSEEELILNWKPKLVVKTYSFKIKVEGLHYVSTIIGSVDGMSSCFRLGKCCGMMSNAPIYFEGIVGANEIIGSFTTFGMPEDMNTRASGGMVKMTLAFVKTDQSIQKIEVDITSVVTDPGSGGGTPGEENPSKEIEIPLEDGGITVEKPTNPPSGGDGGIGGDVGDWGDEEDVILPVN